MMRYSVSRLSLVMGACGLVFILATAGFIALHERQAALRDARLSAQGAAFSLADHAARLFEVADLALRTTTLALDNDDWDTAERSRPLWTEMRATAQALPYISDLWLNDDKGRLRVTTVAFPTPMADLSDRPPFQAVRDGDRDLVIGDPVVGRVTAVPTFLIARRLEGNDGRFRGMVSATADLAYFTRYWRRLDLPNDTHVALVRAAGARILVRVPEGDGDTSDDVAALQAAIAGTPLTGHYKTDSGRSVYVHQIGTLPLYLTVSYDVAAVTHGWSQWLWSFLLVPGAAILALAAIMAMARRQSRVEALAAFSVNRARAELEANNQQLEHRVAERTMNLRETNAEIQRFAYIVSHDLRAPLVNITGFTSELQRLRDDLFTEPQVATDMNANKPRAAMPQLREDFDEAIGFIQTSIDKMDRLIMAILLLARQGSRVFDPEAVDSDALMRSIADGVAHRVQSAGARIDIGPLPRLVIDRIAVEQLFSNLVDNAVKYLRPDVPGQIIISAEIEGDRAVFRVADNGRGIDPRDHSRVFDLFRRSGAQDRPGDGIGLAHVRTLVRQLGGTIALNSTLGEGSVLIVALPLTFAGAAT